MIHALVKLKTINSFQYHLADRMFPPFFTVLSARNVDIGRKRILIQLKNRYETLHKILFRLCSDRRVRTITSNVLPTCALLERIRFDNV